MAPSVLGKRTRSSIESGTVPLSATLRLANSSRPDSKPAFSRVKRQARAEIFNDENENPFLSRSAREETQDGDPMDIDELSEPIISRSTPAKHGRVGSRVPLSPSKFKTHHSRQ